MHLILGLAGSRGLTDVIKSHHFCSASLVFLRLRSPAGSPTDGVERPCEVLGLHPIFSAAPTESVSNNFQQYPQRVEKQLIWGTYPTRNQLLKPEGWAALIGCV